jgi:hypothetical protein
MFRNTNSLWILRHFTNQLGKKNHDANNLEIEFANLSIE